MLDFLARLFAFFKRESPPPAAPLPTPAKPAPAQPAPAPLPTVAKPQESVGISVEGLVRLGVSRANAEKHAPALNRACHRYNIRSHARICGFLAQVCHESRYLSVMRESLNYSAERLCVVFPTKFKSLDDAAKYVGDRDKLAEKLYGGKIGNNQPGDGAKFTGRGFIQLTGKANYRDCGDSLGIDLVSVPALAEGSEVAALAAAWFFWKNGCNEISDANTEDAVRKATKVVNGGQNGIEDRLAIWHKAKRVLSTKK